MKRLAALVLILCALAAAPFALRAETAAQRNGGEAADAKGGVAIFAAGCFWCVEADFDKVPGVLSTTNGYIGGKYADPTYDLVALGITGHVEAVRVTYDPAKVSYKQLLDHYWHHVDLTDGRGQFCDRGSAYRPVIFASDGQQKAEAEASKKAIEDSKRFAHVAVEIKPAFRFWPAEAEHQDFYRKNPYRYKFYRFGCGRDARLMQLWGSEYAH